MYTSKTLVWFRRIIEYISTLEQSEQQKVVDRVIEKIQSYDAEFLDMYGIHKEYLLLLLK
jgi:hypothetical protein